MIIFRNGRPLDAVELNANFAEVASGAIGGLIDIFRDDPVTTTQPMIQSFNTIGGTVTPTGVTSTNSHIKSNVYGQVTRQWNAIFEIQQNGADVVGENVAGYFQANNFSTGASASSRRLWAACFEGRDSTGLGSSSGGVLQPVEVDIFANGLDDLSGQIGRTAISIVLGQHNTGGSAVEASYAINVTRVAGQSGSFKKVYGVSTPYSEAAFDNRLGTQGASANAIWLANSDRISFDTSGVHKASSDGTNLNFSVSGNTALRLSAGPIIATNINAASRTRLGRTSIQPGSVSFSGAFSSNEAPFAVLMTATGTPTGTSGSTFYYNKIAISSDTATCGASLEGAALGIEHNVGAGATGSRRGLGVNLSQVSQTGASGIGDNPFFEGIVGIVGITATEGGTDTSLTGSKGHSFAYAGYSRLGASVTNWHSMAGMELDLSAAAGATYAVEVGLQIIHLSTHGAQGARLSSAIVISDQSGSGAGWKSAIRISHPEGVWALDTTKGEILTARLGNGYTTSPQDALNGINFLDANFSGYAYQSQGVAIDGDGVVRVGTLYLTPSSDGVTLSASGSVGTAEGATISGAGIVSGGTSGFVVNAILRHRASGAVYTVATVNGSGQVTSVNVYRQAYVDGTPPATLTLETDSAYNGVGTVEVTEAWTARSNIMMPDLPTSSAGLPTGALWNDTGTLKIA